MPRYSSKGRKWKVMGRDTFSREDYVVREFPSEEAAREWVRAREATNERTQDDGVRDEYWVMPAE